MAKCLVLGANGFIGSHLVDELAEAGHFVRCFDRYKSDKTTFTNDDDHNIEVFSGNFLNRSSLEIALEDIEYVFHLVSTTTPITSDNDPIIDIETNIKMSIELFKLCSEKKQIKRLIFASTGGAIYGNSLSDTPINEEVYPKPVSPYAIGKLTIENYLRYFKIKHDLNYLVLRISNPFGPRQNTFSGQGVIPIFLDKVLNDKPLTVYGDGTMVRDYIYIKDVSNMISKVFDQDIENSDVYNIGSGKGRSVNDIVRALEEAIGEKIPVENMETPTTFVNKIVLDTSKFTSKFSLTPVYDFKKGIEETWQHLKNHQ